MSVPSLKRSQRSGEGSGGRRKGKRHACQILFEATAFSHSPHPSPVHLTLVPLSPPFLCIPLCLPPSKWSQGTSIQSLTELIWVTQTIPPFFSSSLWSCHSPCPPAPARTSLPQANWPCHFSARAASGPMVWFAHSALHHNVPLSCLCSEDAGPFS